MGKVDARRVGVVLGLMLSMGLTTIWVQAQEQTPADAPAAAEAVELASGQEAAEAAEQAGQAERAGTTTANPDAGPGRAVS